MAGATALPTQFVEYHPSMSLERPASMLELLAAPTDAACNGSTGRHEQLQEPSRIEAASSTPPSTLAAVLSQRGTVWARVSEIIDRLATA
ncbi:hypothetical protein PINS_up009025 [Pythium insidiosum]|nr:hypothetical protein PINS_up009025 [Pythium insidiosum]